MKRKSVDVRDGDLSSNKLRTITSDLSARNLVKGKLSLSDGLEVEGENQ